MGLLLQAQGELVDARPYLEQTLAIRLRVLGEEHSDTATSLNNLAVLHFYAGEFQEAVPLMRRALAVRKALHGSQHPDTQALQQNLAVIEETAQRGQRTLPQTPAQQITAIKQLSDAAVTSALAEGDPQARATLAEQLEARAQWAEDGEASGSPYLALAAHLRGLIVRLRECDGDDTAGDAG